MVTSMRLAPFQLFMTREIPCQTSEEGVGRQNRFLVELVGAALGA